MNTKIAELGHRGIPIECTPEEWWGGLRNALQERAGQWIDNGQVVRAQMALEEVKRLDGIHRKET